MLIHIADKFGADLPDKLKKFGDVSEDPNSAKNADVVLVRSKTKVTKEYMDGAPKLKMVIRGGVGLDNVDVEYAKKKGIIVDNTPEASSVTVAEIAFALMLSVPTRLIEGHIGMKEGKWLKDDLKRTELLGKTLGLIGAGRIATEVAKRAQAFGMKVIAYRKSGQSAQYMDVVPSLDTLLTKSDYISLHTPLTDETKNMINAQTIAKMKDGVIIVNTGRGKCIVEDDVVAALKNNKIRAYATDVWYSDPPAPNCPLLTAPNVFMAPHLGASSKENLARIGEIVIKKLEEFSKKK